MNKEFLAKIIRIQTELKAPKSIFNTYGNFHYRSFEDILEALKPLLAREGLFLSFQDKIVHIGERYYLEATAEVTDGENTKTVTALAREALTKTKMDESQVTGMASTYARKYSMGAFFLLDDNGDSDDPLKKELKNGVPDPDKLTTEQGMEIENYLSALGIKDISNFPKNDPDYAPVINTLQSKKVTKMENLDFATASRIIKFLHNKHERSLKKDE